jgi:hypothetical protein
MLNVSRVKNLVGEYQAHLPGGRPVLNFFEVITIDGA